MGGIAGYYGNNFTLPRVGVTALGGGLSAQLTGGDFRNGFEAGGIQGLMAYGWNQMRNFTDSVGKRAAAEDPKRFAYTADGSLDTAGTIKGTSVTPRQYPSFFGARLDKIFAPITRILDHLGMESQGYSAQGYDKWLPTWLGGGQNGPIAAFVNQVSKVHDFYEGWDYSVGLGKWIDRGEAFNGLYDIYGMAGMPPSGVYAAAALSPSTVFALQRHQ